MKGFEIDADNDETFMEGGVDCNPLDGSGFGPCNDLVLVSNGSNAVSAALQIRGAPATGGTFKEGEVFSTTCCTVSTIDDYSSSTNSILIQGSHATAAINIAAGAGNIVMNDNNIASVGTIALLGSSGSTTLEASSSAGGVATLPDNSGTIAETNLAQTWSATQAFDSGALQLNGAASGKLTLNCAAMCGVSIATLPANTGTIAETDLAHKVDQPATIHQRRFCILDR
jgi:hypothetical protein